MQALFVDDDINILHALERSLFGLGDDWKMRFTTSTSEALRIVDGENPELIISDMRMPECDGAELLSEVRNINPGCARAILSGFRDDSAAVRSTESAHRFLTKPMSGAELLSQMNAMTRATADNYTRELVAGINYLPTPLHIQTDLLRALTDPNSTAREIASIVLMDPAMTAKVLQLANSSFFGRAALVTDVATAVNKIGTEALRDLATSYGFSHTIDSFNSRGDLLTTDIQERAQARALEAKQDHGIDGDFQYLATLLSHTGLLLYAHYGLDVRNSGGFEDHRNLGVALLKLWGIPCEITAAIPRG